MRFLGLAAVFVAAVAAAAVLFSAFPRSSRSSDTLSAGIPTHTPAVPTPQPTPEPRTWVAGLKQSNHGVAMLVSCLDVNHDGRIDYADGADYANVDIPLVAEKSCVEPAHHSDYYVGDPAGPGAFACGDGPAPLLIVAVGSAGTDLFDATAGESLGVLDIVNQLQARAGEQGIASVPLISASAIFGADESQTRNEEWLANEVELRLDAMPCLRAVLVGHSHGGAAVTTIAADLDAAYADRVYGVIIDRTTVLYDRDAKEVPEMIPLLNVFQTNEGWHGVPYDLANVTNVDESAERAPVSPSDGGGGLALVSHKTLDDSAAVQERIVTAVMSWLAPTGR